MNLIWTVLEPRSTKNSSRTKFKDSSLWFNNSSRNEEVDIFGLITFVKVYEGLTQFKADFASRWRIMPSGVRL